MFLHTDPETKAPAVHMKNVFNKEQLTGLIANIKTNAPAVKATHLKDGKFLSDEESVRKSTVRWFWDGDFESVMRQAVDVANYISGWRYDIVKPEILQFTEYEKGGYYSLHTDGNGCHKGVRDWQTTAEQQNLEQTRDPQLLGTVRKLSVTVILNDNYEGGELQFVKQAPEEAKLITTEIKPEVGSAIVFPSYVHHRVKPVTKGTRYSIVAWYGGPPFK